MKHYNRIIFLKQDIFKLSTVVFWLLSLLAGASIIFSIEYLGGSFRIDNVYAMFTTISEWLILFCAVNLFGKEFYYKTINMIRISNKSHVEILARKWITMMTICVLTALVSFIEVAVYSKVFERDIDIVMLGGRLVLAYCIYGTFLYAFATPIVMLIKNTLYSFMVLFIALAIVPMLLSILSGLGASYSVMKLIPFTFMRDSFSFARYSGSQIAVMVVWSVLLLVLSHTLLKKKGYV